MTQNLPKDIRIEQIINAAAREFVEHGYENTTMEKIAARAGLTKGGLYHHFNSKDEILLAATRKFAEPITEIMTRAATLPSAELALRTVINQYLSYWNNHRTEMAFYFLTMVKSTQLPNLASMYEDYFKEILAYYQQLFDRGIAAGEFRRHDTCTRATGLVSALDGAAGYLLIDRKAEVQFFDATLQQLFIDEIVVVN